MAQSIKLSDDIMKIARRESELQSRSIAGQIAHWVRIGRDIEKSGHFDHARISAVLSDDIEETDLTDEEKDVWLDDFVEQMGKLGLTKMPSLLGDASLGWVSALMPPATWCGRRPPATHEATKIVLAGPNGAGKSTLYETRVAPRSAGPFINAETSATKCATRNEKCQRPGFP